MNRRLLVNAVGLQVAWFAAVGGAASGRPEAGPLVAAALLVLHLAFAVAPGERGAEVRLLLVALAVGTVLESTNRALSLVEPVGAPAALPATAPWLLGLWVVFAATFRHSFAWAGRRTAVAVVLGAAGSWPGFLAAARWGALDLPRGAPLAAIVIAVEWAVILPVLLRLAAADPADPPAAARPGRPAVPGRVA